MKVSNPPVSFGATDQFTQSRLWHVANKLDLILYFDGGVNSECYTFLTFLLIPPNYKLHTFYLKH